MSIRPSESFRESHLSFHLFFFTCNKVTLYEGVPVGPLDGRSVGRMVGNQLFLPAYLERHMPYIQPCLLPFVLKDITSNFGSNAKRSG